MQIPSGRESEAALFSNSLKIGKTAQAYIIHAPEGMGKKTFAGYVLSLFMCQTHSSCDACPSCQSLKAGTHPDVYEVKREKDKASVGIDVVRQMTSQVFVRPVMADFKAVVIYEAHLLTIEAQNAMLKIIEEPPEKVVFFLLCDTLAPILSTILSRCVTVGLKPLPNEILKNTVSQNLLGFELDYSSGNPGRLKKLVADGEFSSLRDELTEKIAALSSDDAYSVYRAAEFMEKNKDKRDEMMSIILFFMRDALFKKLKADSLIVNKDKINQINAFSKHCGARECFNALCTVTEIQKNRGKNGNFSIAAVNMLLKCREEIHGRSYGNTL